MKILIFGLPGTGKTYLAERLQKYLNCAWYNADVIRGLTRDWDFSTEGRERQSLRMKNLADFEKDQGRTVICDFVCPTRSTRNIFNPDFSIWMNTVSTGRFEDTNKIFEKPDRVDLVVEQFLSDKEILMVAGMVRGGVL